MSGEEKQAINRKILNLIEALEQEREKTKQYLQEREMQKFGSYEEEEEEEEEGTDEINFPSWKPITHTNFNH